MGSRIMAREGSGVSNTGFFLMNTMSEGLRVYCEISVKV
jgi:hypothetical protein